MVRVTKPGGRIAMVRDTFFFNMPDQNPEQLIDSFQHYYVRR